MTSNNFNGIVQRMPKKRLTALFQLFIGLVIALIFIGVGAVIYQGSESYWMNLYTEIAGIIVTVALINWIAKRFDEQQEEQNKKRSLQQEEQNKKQSLYEEMFSANREVAQLALEHYLKDFHRIPEKPLDGVQWKGTQKLKGRDLSGANFSRADLSEADLERANLRNANLTGANSLCARMGETTSVRSLV